MKIKRIFSSVMALGLATTLVACGGESAPADNPATDGQATETVEETTDAETEDTAEDADDTAETTEELSADETAEVENFESQTAGDTLVVGVPTLNGDFIQGFGNDANDVSVRRFLGIEGVNGFWTYVLDENGQMQWNAGALAEEPKSEENEDGSITVTFKIRDDLKWSDGEPVTVDDYLFYTLLKSDYNYIPMSGSMEIGADSLVGYDEFHDGSVDEFAGIEKIDDYTFSETIKADELPYFDIEALAQATANPMHYIAPNLAVADNGKKLVVKEGYEVTEADKENYIKSLDTRIGKLNEAFEESYPETPAEDSEEYEGYQAALEERDGQVAELEEKKEGEVDPTRLLIDQAIIFETEDYRFNPAVTEGPYKFDSYENNMVKMSLNEHYAGNFRGDKATIPNVIMQVVNKSIAVDLLESGDIDIWEDETEGGKIDQMRAAADRGDIQIGSFERNGYGNLTFLADRGATQYKEIRQAIAYLLDRNEFVANYAGGYGVVTNGMYGTSQWMYHERGADVENEITTYTLNIDKANELLDASPYKYEADGTTPWDFEKAQAEFDNNLDNWDYYRYDENGNRLVVNQFGSDESPITTLISNQLPVNAAQVGMEYNVTAGAFSTLVDLYYYPEEDAEYTAFNMGTGFGTPFDPWLYYSSEGPYNKTNTNDPRADEVTEAMRRTDPEDREGYLDKWEEFQAWYNDYLPEIPLYSNIYHTGYSNRVQGFDIMSPTWHSYEQINAMSLAE